MTPDEKDFRERYVKACTDWPGVVNPGEPEPDEQSLQNGWKTIQLIEAEFIEKLGAEYVEQVSTAIAEGVADFSRAGLTRGQIVAQFDEEVRSSVKWVAIHEDSDDTKVYGYFASDEDAIMYAVDFEHKAWNESYGENPWNLTGGSPHRGTEGEDHPDPFIEYFDDLTDCGWKFLDVIEVVS